MTMRIRSFLCALLATFALTPATRAEVILQYFETRWDEMYQRLPEIAEIGYESMWTPPPGKSPIGGPYPFAYGGNVGYNSFDRFDLGDQPQRGNWETRYGSRTSLRSMVDNAHQTDIKIYPDIVSTTRATGRTSARIPAWCRRISTSGRTTLNPAGSSAPRACMSGAPTTATAARSTKSW